MTGALGHTGLELHHEASSYDINFDLLHATPSVASPNALRYMNGLYQPCGSPLQLPGAAPAEPIAADCLPAMTWSSGSPATAAGPICRMPSIPGAGFGFLHVLVASQMVVQEAKRISMAGQQHSVLSLSTDAPTANPCTEQRRCAAQRWTQLTMMTL